MSIEIETPCDDINEPAEYFEVVANITSHSDAKFGGAAHSTTGSMLVEIQNRKRNLRQCRLASYFVFSLDPPPTKTLSPPTPSPSPEPCTPDHDCSGQGCNWRTGRVSRNTFRNNEYTFGEILTYLNLPINRINTSKLYERAAGYATIIYCYCSCSCGSGRMWGFGCGEYPGMPSHQHLYNVPSDNIHYSHLLQLHTYVFHWRGAHCWSPR